ncbi:MAG: hypothetical protein ACPG80_01385 [Rickettsiales bacterium]
MEDLLKACGEASVMIMGMSFIIGSLVTIFVLVVLDMMRSRGADGAADE